MDARLYERFWHAEGFLMSELTSQGISVHAGFPNAATDASLSSLDLGKLLVQNPSSTFFMRVRGSDGEHMAIYDGDIVVLDRALQPRRFDRVIWWQGDSFVVGLPAAVPRNMIPWGVITYVIHGLRGHHA